MVITAHHAIHSHLTFNVIPIIKTKIIILKSKQVLNKYNNICNSTDKYIKRSVDNGDKTDFVKQLK